jgi:hypothetical protein
MRSQTFLPHRKILAIKSQFQADVLVVREFVATIAGTSNLTAKPEKVLGSRIKKTKNLYFPVVNWRQVHVEDFS